MASEDESMPETVYAGNESEDSVIAQLEDDKNQSSGEEKEMEQPNDKTKGKTEGGEPDNSKKNNKRKKKSTKAESDTEEAKAQQAEKKQKKPRVKPEKVQEVYGKIIEQMVRNYKIGLTEIPTDTLAIAVGYKHPRSDAIQDALKLLKRDGLVEKSTKVCKFTEQGIKEHVPAVKSAENAEEAMEQFWKHYETKLAGSKKSSGGKVLEAAQVVWNELKDGKGHSAEDLVDKTTYGMTRSTGFEQVMKALKDLGFTHKVNGKVEFTDKLFPFGRPSSS